MGNGESKLDFKGAVSSMISANTTSANESFWKEFTNTSSSFGPRDLFVMMKAEDIRELRDKSPNNFSALVFKSISILVDNCKKMSTSDHKKVSNAIHFLTRVVPFMYENEEWRNYFWNAYPDQNNTDQPSEPIASKLLMALSNLLFVIDFTVTKVSDESMAPDGKQILDTCEYIWEAGVGFTNKMGINGYHDENRVAILKVMLICFSEFLYTTETDTNRMRWITRFTSAENKHVLPIFTSLLNVICAYNPAGLGLPYNYMISSDSREPLVKAALQLLIVSLDVDTNIRDDTGYADNLFIQYLSRIHREDDFTFMLQGITTLLNNPLQSTYFPNSAKKITFHQELLVLLWKCCEYNQKFMYYVLKTSDILEILVPILFFINESRGDSAKVSLIHMGIFQILLLSGERNFGVRLNKPYVAKLWMDVPSFNGTHADLLIIVFHKLITTGNHRLQSLFDCLLTIIVNVSPYLKSLTMVAANKLVHLVEAFSTPWFLFSTPTHYNLIFLKRQVFYQLSNMNPDSMSIVKHLEKKKAREVSESQQVRSDLEKSEGSNIFKKEEIAIDVVPSDGILAGPSPLSIVGGSATEAEWVPTVEWIESWKNKLPLQTINRLLQVLVPQVEKICIDKGLTDESEILKFLQHGTLVGLLPVPHPIVIRKYQANTGTNSWFRTYMWGIIFMLNNDPPIWFETNVNLLDSKK
uniref:Protein HID1 n=1 Tax=Rhabditophanes sp. KR3021 TaxID=114890 RepID=A0AC35TX04_9BILA